MIKATLLWLFILQIWLWNYINVQYNWKQNSIKKLISNNWKQWETNIPVYQVGCITTQIKTLLTVCIMQDFVNEFLVRYTLGKKALQNKPLQNKVKKTLKLFLAIVFLVYRHYVCILWNTDYVYILWKSQWMSFCIIENWDFSMRKRSYESKNLSTSPVPKFT